MIDMNKNTVNKEGHGAQQKQEKNAAENTTGQKNAKLQKPVMHINLGPERLSGARSQRVF